MFLYQYIFELVQNNFALRNIYFGRNQTPQTIEIIKNAEIWLSKRVQIFRLSKFQRILQYHINLRHANQS